MVNPAAAVLTAGEAARLVLQARSRGETAVVALVLSGPAQGGRAVLVRSPRGELRRLGTLEDTGLQASIEAELPGVLDGTGEARRKEAGTRLLHPEGHEHGTPIPVYFEVTRPPAGLLIVGAGHLAEPLHEVGALLGFRVTVVDDRPGFARAERFPRAAAVTRVDFSDPFREIPPQDRTHVLLVTRGHRYDYECLRLLLMEDPLPEYLGMIGSRRRVRATFHQLLEEGIPRERLGRIHAPVGLDVGAETPAEIAVAVAAEWIQHRRGGSGRSLTQVERVAQRFFGEGE